MSQQSVARGELVPLSERQMQAVVITSEQMDLIKTTVAKDATDAELGLFLYDCKRRGLHPLDRLLHFTKRAGKYTPVTSIDLFRSRAAESGEHMGTDDAVFIGQPTDPDFQATVTVYRMVQGEKCPFTATARMSEYLPEESNAFMWRKMPHGQLGKCAEALALRKGFPQQLADLHTFEEMEQSHTDPPPRATTTQQPQRKSESGTPAPAGAEKKVETKGAPADALTIVGLVASVDRPTGKKVSYIKLKGDRREFSAFNDAGAQVIADAQQFEGTDHQVRLTYVERKQGDKTYYNAIAVAIAETPAAANPAPIDTAAINPFDRTPWQEG